MTPARTTPRAAGSKAVAAEEIQAALARLADAIAQRHERTGRLILLGIANGGVPVARRLASRIKARRSPGSFGTGTLDISFHRDDIGRHPIPKEFAPTLLPEDVDGATVVLADDVLFTGRSVKAALDELFDHGRPAKVELAVLAQRDGRRLPVQPDYAGFVFEMPEESRIAVALDPSDPKRDRLEILPAPRRRS